jgi:hypothetical protein
MLVSFLKISLRSIPAHGVAHLALEPFERARVAALDFVQSVRRSGHPGTPVVVRKLDKNHRKNSHRPQVSLAVSKSVAQDGIRALNQKLETPAAVLQSLARILKYSTKQ